MRMTFDEPLADVPEEEIALNKATKECPFCAETILAKAIKCRHCGEFLTADRPAPPPPPPFQQPAGQSSQAPKKWYHSTMLLIVAIATLGPMALPMVWTNPRYSRTVKAAITLSVLILTVLLCYAMAKMTSALIIKPIQEMGL